MCRSQITRPPVAGHDVNMSGDLDSAEEVEAALADGSATSGGELTQFVCPVIRVPR